MVKIIDYALNPILTENEYPELRVKIGIDVGENQIVRLGGSVDLLGYTMSIVGKIIQIAEPGHVIIGKWVYDVLQTPLKRLFTRLKLSPDVWNYRDSKEAKFYSLYLLNERQEKNGKKLHEGMRSSNIISKYVYTPTGDSKT